MPDGTLKANAALEIAAENQTELAKVAWLSKKQNGKAYGSLVAYFTKGSEAQRFLHEGYMYVGRESANMSRFDRINMGPYTAKGILPCFIEKLSLDDSRWHRWSGHMDNGLGRKKDMVLSKAFDKSNIALVGAGWTRKPSVL